MVNILVDSQIRPLNVISAVLSSSFIHFKNKNAARGAQSLMNLIK